MVNFLVPNSTQEGGHLEGDKSFVTDEDLCVRNVLYVTYCPATCLLNQSNQLNQLLLLTVFMCCPRLASNPARLIPTLLCIHLCVLDQVLVNHPLPTLNTGGRTLEDPTRLQQKRVQLSASHSHYDMCSWQCSTVRGCVNEPCSARAP